MIKRCADKILKYNENMEERGTKIYKRYKKRGNKKRQKG